MSNTSTTLQRKDSFHRRLQVRSGPGLNVKMASITLFSPIAKQRVTRQTPPSPGDEIDVARVAALHNTLLLYGWVCSGKKIPQMEKKSWWSKHGNPSLQKLLRPHVVRYLSKVFDVPNHNVFYHISSLATEKEMLQLGEVLEDNDHDSDKTEKHRFIVLYKTSRNHVSQPAGIVYVFDHIHHPKARGLIQLLQIRPAEESGHLDANIPPHLRFEEPKPALAKTRNHSELLD